MLFPNAFLTVAAVGNMEHVPERNLAAGSVQDRQEMAVPILVIGDNCVTLSDPHARLLTAELARSDMNMGRHAHAISQRALFLSH